MSRICVPPGNLVVSLGVSQSMQLQRDQVTAQVASGVQSDRGEMVCTSMQPCAWSVHQTDGGQSQSLPLGSSGKHGAFESTALIGARSSKPQRLSDYGDSSGSFHLPAPFECTANRSSDSWFWLRPGPSEHLPSAIEDVRRQGVRLTRVFKGGSDCQFCRPAVAGVHQRLATCGCSIVD
ncbi:hypothetical protein N657DRAFT_447298 [Parathielavia appendiculata]|uniref:Uncharacterized protein n=1 Tax=Parathielavia appendiculata TaxID=2587402 RepID=A0AAN6TYI9_9PEZI|nr:hypothetical protein N657DRAFT_447298 [Parathielavia appendiculata]